MVESYSPMEERNTNSNPLTTNKIYCDKISNNEQYILSSSYINFSIIKESKR